MAFLIQWRASYLSFNYYYYYIATYIHLFCVDTRKGGNQTRSIDPNLLHKPSLTAVILSDRLLQTQSHTRDDENTDRLLSLSLSLSWQNETAGSVRLLTTDMLSLIKFYYFFLHTRTCHCSYLACSTTVSSNLANILSSIFHSSSRC